MIQIRLSVKQRETLQPLFDEVDAYGLIDNNNPGAVLLQAGRDGKTGYADAAFVYPDQVVEIRKITGVSEPLPHDDEIPF